MKLQTEKINARKIFFGNRRFDLIFKYLFLKNHPKYAAHTDFFEDCYAEHIRAFNHFNEGKPSDGIPKESKEEFLRRFLLLRDSIKANGFDENLSPVPIDDNLELCDGAHRLSVCAYLDLDIPVRRCRNDRCYDYKFFMRKWLDPFYADYAALEYVKLNKDAYIVNLHAVTDPAHDGEVEAILNRHGFVFYKKNIGLTFDGYVNLKKLSYGFDFFTGSSWVGDAGNKFAGAQNHARKSIGGGKFALRAYVFVCDDPEKVRAAKKEIRGIYGIGNHSVHINDTHGEAVRLAQTFFNDNSLYVFNNRPFCHQNEYFDGLLGELNQMLHERGIDPDDVCAAGSTPLDVLDIRVGKDLDFLYCGDAPFEPENHLISNHDSQLRYYPRNKFEIIKNPKYHFYHNGMKFITLDVLHAMKTKRNERPKDVNDCKLIRNFQKTKRRFRFVLYRKDRIGDLRKITVCNLTFSYKRTKRKKAGN